VEGVGWRGRKNGKAFERNEEGKMENGEWRMENGE
jgi:hypothetical protein